MERIIIKSFKNLKNIKNRDEYVKICQINYVNTFLEVIGVGETVDRILPTEIINSNLENKFLDVRVLTESGKIIIIEGQTLNLKAYDLQRYWGYEKDTYCDFAKNVKVIVACLSDGKNLKKLMVEDDVCFRPMVVELKKIKGEKYLNNLRFKFKNQVELDHKDCGLLVHLPLLKLPISEKEYVKEICGYIKEYDCIPDDERNVVIPAMYLNIAQHFDNEYEQEKLLEAINVLKYCENALDKKIRLAREDEARKIRKELTKQVTEQVTKEVTEQVTEQVTKEVTEEVSEVFACNLLKSGSDFDFVHKMTGVGIERIKELNANL